MKLMVKVQSLGLIGLLCLVFMAALIVAQSGGVLAWSGDSTMNAVIGPLPFSVKLAIVRIGK